MLLVISLVAGLVLAVVFQLMLTNLGIALGLTVLDLSPDEAGETAESGRGTAEQDAAEQDVAEQNLQNRKSTPLPVTSLPITHLAGFGIAATLTGVLFAGALLGTEFSEIVSPRRGAIFGLMLWGAYWLLFLWLSTMTLAGVAGTVLETITAGGRRLVGAVRQSMQPSQDTPQDEQTLLKSLVAAVGQEALAMEALPQLMAEERDKLVEEICDRTRLTPEQANTVLDDISPASQPTAESSSPVISNTGSPDIFTQLNLPSWRQLLLQGLDQIDVDDLDLDTLWQQAQQLVKDDQGIEGAVKTVAQNLQPGFVSVLEDAVGEPPKAATLEQPVPISLDSVPLDEPVHPKTIETIQNKLEAYCRYTRLDSITPERLVDKLNAQLEEHELSLQAVNQRLDLDAIESVLSHRKNITKEQQSSLIPALQSALFPGPETDANQNGNQTDRNLYDRLEGYFRTVDWGAVPVESVKAEVMHLLHALEYTGEVDWSRLAERVSVPPELRAELLNWLRTAWKPPVRWAKQAGHSTQDWVEQLSDQVADYLRQQDQLEPEQLSSAVGQLVKGGVRSRLPRLSSLPDLSLPDTHAWKDALAERRDLTAQEIQEILQHTETAWHQTRHGVETLWTGVTDRISEEVDKATATVRSQVVDRIETAQQAVQDQANAAQRQADAVRGQVAIAVWWLFLSLLLSGTGSAVAGWLASQY